MEDEFHPSSIRMLDVEAGASTVVDFALVPDSLELGEIVAVAYGTQEEMMLAEGDVEGAVRAFRSILQDDPTRVDIWKHMAIALAAAGRCAEARQALQSALSYRPDDASLRRMSQGLCQVEGSPRSLPDSHSGAGGLTGSGTAPAPSARESSR